MKRSLYEQYDDFENYSDIAPDEDVELTDNDFYIKEGKLVDMDEETIADFVELVRKGHRNNPNATAGRIIGQVERFCVIYRTSDNEPFACLAIKGGFATNKQWAFEKAGIPEMADEFRYELGFFYVTPEYMFKKINVDGNVDYPLKIMFDTLSPHLKGKPFFITIRTPEAKRFQRILEFLGMERLGRPYQSITYPGTMEIWAKR